MPGYPIYIINCPYCNKDLSKYRLEFRTKHREMCKQRETFDMGIKQGYNNVINLLKKEKIKIRGLNP